jgi:hypothetical protein
MSFLKPSTSPSENNNSVRNAVRSILMIAALSHAGTTHAEAELIGKTEAFPARPTLVERNTTTEVMAEKEIISMQKAQMALLRNYLNPSYVLFLRTIGIFEQVNAAMETAIQHSKELTYQEEMGSIKLTKRPTSKNTDISDNFSLTIKDGLVTEANGEMIESVGSEGLHDFMQKIVAANKLLMKHGGEGADDRDWTIFSAYALDLPHRIKRSIELRNAEGALYPAEAANPGLSEFLTRLADHPKNEKEKRDPDKNPNGKISKLFIFVYPDTQDQNEVIEIVRPKTEDFLTIMAISPEGFILKKNADDKWELPDAYKDAFKKRYGTPKEPRYFPLDTTSTIILD